MESETEPGLMAQIQALIAPPPSEAPPKPKRKDREEKKKRGQNRDACDACGECGNLVCCEKCPAALHSRCMEPPLEDDELPLGEWLCRICLSKSNKPKEKKCLEMEEKVQPLDLLIKAIEQQNPVRFTLGRRINTSFPFPGSEKGPKKVATRRTSALKKPAPEVLKTCFECRRGARVASLVQCDYCSSCYHLDCLDPPLTSPPLCMWMCPNHPEHFIDANLLTSTSGMERAKLWAQVARDFDQEAVKLEFIRKITRRNPPFRYKVKKPERVGSSIPAAVKFLYANPLPRPPTLPNNIKHARTWKSGEQPTPTEKSEWLSGLFALQLSLAWDLFKETTEEKVDDGLEDVFNKNKKLNRTAVEAFFTQLENLRISAPLDEQITKMDPRLLKLLAVQGLKQIMPKNNVNRSVDTKVKIKEEAEDTFAVFDENLFLKNGVVCSKKKYVALKDINNELKVEEWKDHKRPLRASVEEEKLPLAPARAALAPIGSLAHIAPAVMRGKTLTIGTSPDSDVCLTDYGVCQFVSPKHAVIFYDAMTGEYELLNYSQYGSTVDGCLYCIDGTQCRVPSAPSVADPLTQSVRAMLDKRRGLKRDNGAVYGVPVHALRPPRRISCGCGEKFNDVTGWEGSALLHHCSLLQFGCLQFVFSVVDFAPNKVLSAEDVEKKKKRAEENGDVVKIEEDNEVKA